MKNGAVITAGRNINIILIEINIGLMTSERNISTIPCQIIEIRIVKINKSTKYPKVFHHLPLTSCLLLFKEARIFLFSFKKTKVESDQKTPNIIPGMIRSIVRPVRSKPKEIENPKNAQYLP